jgi:hypothetical protein
MFGDAAQVPAQESVDRYTNNGKDTLAATSQID